MAGMPRKILVTSALPYANGALHLGHIIEATQTDIWVRFQKMRGNDCLYCCAEDAHGTPIMIRAQQENKTPEALIAAVATEHQRDYAGFLIEFDQFHSTHSEENRVQTISMYEALVKAGHITRRSVSQAYDEQAGMFLPDRFIRGTCPRCGTADQYGDSCENCGATYSPADLKDPVSTVTNTPPVWRDSEHLFFKLGDFEAMLRDWLVKGTLSDGVRAKLGEWFEAGLKDWDISRESPYFGFEIPDAPGKFFYVWFDAPIGYIGSFRALAARRDLSFDEYWRSETASELYHFIGKDIQYFHTLFWPAVLYGAGLRRPTSVFVHGFLTVDGQKMSKSRGTFITAERYLQCLPPEPLRYYFAAKLGSGLDDIDLNLEDFVARVNSDIVGKLVNIASRCAPFVERSGGKLATSLPDAALHAGFTAQSEAIAKLFESREYANAVREIMALADRANQYVDQMKPWIVAKDPARVDEVRGIATQGINLFRVLLYWLAPVIPKVAAEARTWLGESGAPLWGAAGKPLLGTPLGRYQPLATRLDPAVVKNLVASEATPVVAPKLDAAPGSIGIGDFAKLDLRVAKVIAAQVVDGSDKLLQLTLDLGAAQRQVFSGIRSSYKPEDMVGRLVLMVANLAPRKMRFGVSEGMVLCASGSDAGVFLLSPDSGAQPGMKVN
ncbi:MAG: methionine--tRNA ligase [Steroidobacteraceae bacterium]